MTSSESGVQAFVDELMSAASLLSWHQRYDALEKAVDLPMALRRRVAEEFLSDSNAYVRSLAESLARASPRLLRSRAGILQDFDQALSGTKLSMAQRSRIRSLFEDMQEAGSLGYLALSADRAARLVTAAMNVTGAARSRYLEELNHFIRHLAAFASPGLTTSTCDSISAIVDSIARSSKVRVTVHGSDNAQVNRDALKTALTELLVNAADAKAERMEVETAHSNGMMRILVSNDGAPLDKEAERHLFEPWYTTRTGRAGLGLYLALLSVRRAGGEITHRLGEGTSFEIALPVASTE